MNIELTTAQSRIAVSILVSYAAYLTAEAIHASGVLAVVAAGLYLGRKSSQFLSPGVRLQARAVWDLLTFILNGFVFVLIGLQLPSVLAGVSELSTRRLILYGALFSIFLILLRILWTFPGAYVSYFIRRRLLHQSDKRPGARQIFVVGWTGMRGVIALAAAMSLPQTVADGSPFPHRDLIVFLTFCVILVTLVFQGLTLPPLISNVGSRGDFGTPSAKSRKHAGLCSKPLRHVSKTSVEAIHPVLLRYTTIWSSTISTVSRVSVGLAMEQDKGPRRALLPIPGSLAHAARG